MNIVAYTAEGDVYCAECAVKRYPGCDDDTKEIVCSDGTVVTPVFSTDSVPIRWCCADCHNDIDTGEYAESIRDMVQQLSFRIPLTQSEIMERLGIE